MLPNLQRVRQRPFLLLILLLTIVPLARTQKCRTEGRQKNIVFILADDAGWADFESHDPSMATPNIKLLREEGIFLNQSYTLPMCGPARAALLTGRYPHTMGMQNNAVKGPRKTWLNETLTLMPQAMKKLGYKTHMLGKWHMGSCHPGLLPLGRGFDTFYGFWFGAHNSYYNHTKTDKNNVTNYDWWDQDKPDFSAKGKYQTDILNDRAVRIIEESKWDQPFFMYLAYGAPHGPFQVPDHYVDKFCPHITNRSRQIHCGMMAALDVGVGRIVQALKNKGLYSNTVIVLMSDNGGPVLSGSVNWPLRGGKKSLFEGGTRSYTVLRAPGLAKTNITWSGKVHAIDWLDTFVEIGGGTKPAYTHGQSHWEQILRNEAGLRTSFIYNVDEAKNFNHMAIRMNQWKLIGAIPGLSAEKKWSAGLKAGWYPPYQLLDSGEANWDDFKLKGFPTDYALFDIEQDPEERNNVAKKNPKIVEEMRDLLISWVGDSFNSPNVSYPLQPLFKTASKGEHAKDGVFVTCWCQPPALAPCSKDEAGEE